MRRAPGPGAGARQQRGHTLLELSAVVLILALLAYAAMPDIAATSRQQLDLTAGLVAEALRFARSESIRSGEVHGVLIDTDDGQNPERDITVFKADSSGSPFASAGTLFHPVSKQPYDFWLNQSGVAANVEFASATRPFSFLGLAQPEKYIFFTARGKPVYLKDGSLLRFVGGDVVLEFGGDTRAITIHPASGRVKLQ